MFKWIVKLQMSGDQYRITLPKKLVRFADLENAEYLRLESGVGGGIIIKEYHGKGKKERGIQEDKS